MDSDLVAFLRARFDGDDEEARRGYLKAEPIPDYDGWDQSTTAGLPPAVAARVLAEVEAKRRLMDEVFRYEAKIDGEWGCCHEAEVIAAGLCPETNPGGIMALRLLALPYARHPDYLPEWALAAE